MLLPDYIRPEDSIYYKGALVLDIIQQEKNISVTDLYVSVKERFGMSFSSMLLCLDWLFLIGCAEVNEFEVKLCS